LTNVKSPVSKAPEPEPDQTADATSASDSGTEIEFEEDEEEDSSTAEQQNVIVSVTPSTEQVDAAAKADDTISAITGATEISFDIESDSDGDAQHEQSDNENIEMAMESEIESEIETEIQSDVETEIHSEPQTEEEEIEETEAMEEKADVFDDDNDEDEVRDLKSAEEVNEYEEDYDEIKTDIVSEENGEAFSSVTSTLSSLAQNEMECPTAKTANDDIVDEAEELLYGIDSDAAKSAVTAESIDSYGSSLERMNVQSSAEEAATKNSESFSDTVSSILSESLSLIDSSAKDDPPPHKDILQEILEEADENGDEDDNYDDDMDELPPEILQPQTEVAMEEGGEVDESPSKGDALPRSDAEQKAQLISVDLISEMVSELFNDTSSLFALRQNRASILCRQHQIERTINESIGLFSEREQPPQPCDADIGIVNDEQYVALYVKEILENCGALDWSSRPVDAIKIDFSVFISVETTANRREEQQIFNNLIFDTLNEELVAFKLKTKRKMAPIAEQIIKNVQARMNKIIICETPLQLKQYFGDEQSIDNRIREISNEWIREFEHSKEWVATFDAFQNSIKFQISDMIFDDFIADIAHELNQIERHRRRRSQ